MENNQSRYVDARKAARSWRPKAGSMSPGLKRARQPFLIKNAITGILLGAFCVGVYTYSINAVKQDEFDDIDEEAKAAVFAKTQAIQNERQAAVLTIDEEKRTMEAAAKAVAASILNAGPTDETSALRVSQKIQVPLASSSSSSLLSSSSPGVVADTPKEPRSQFQTDSLRRRGILVDVLDKRFPNLLDPTRKTFIWGAPPVDNIGSAWQRK